MCRILSLLIFSTLIFSCSNKSEKQTIENSTNGYANGFRITEYNVVKKLTVINPWEKAKNISINYFLISKGDEVPDSLVGKKIIRTPVNRIICLSTTHLAFIDALNETDAVVGISGSQYVSNEKIRKKIKNKDVVDAGYGQNLNYELIVNQQPDLVMVYGIGSEVTSYTHKLEELGVPVIMVAEYLEESPLGKAEWIKFVSTVFEKEEEADIFFNEIEQEYVALQKLAEGKADKPKVLTGSPYKDSWWVPGANSYMANLIKDAGGDYLGKENSTHESYVISFEHALAWANEADVWINMGNLGSKQEIHATDSRFESFRVFREGKLFNNIKLLSEHGGNDFWESGTVYPNLILRDLISIFHPDLIDVELVYYQEIK